MVTRYPFRRWSVGKRVAADDGARLTLVFNRNLKCEELPRFKRRQRNAINRFEMKGTLRMNLVLECAARDTELAPSGPNA